MQKIIHQLLTQSERILITSHVNPDGDAIGSLVAIAHALDALGKETTLFNESPIPAVYRFLSGTSRIVNTVNGISGFDTVVFLDCSDHARAGSLSARLADAPMVINIDHHVTNDHFGDLQLVDISACATAEIIYRLIRAMAVTVTRKMAEAIYTGILTDTGSFRFANTSPDTFLICHELVCCGVEPSRVAKHIYGEYSLGRLRLLNRALDTIELSHDGRLSMMTLTPSMLEETGTRFEDTEGIINYANSIRNVQMAVLMLARDDGDEITQGISPFYVSLRSDGSVDVSAFAAAFGGGGHARAAGFRADMTMADLRSEIVDWFEEQVAGG